MKKTHKFLVPILLINSAILFGCNNHDNRIVLTYGDTSLSSVDIYNKTTQYKYDLSYENLNSKIIAGTESFALAVYPKSACTCWTNFSLIANQYMHETYTTIYRISYESFVGQNNFGLTLDSGSTTFAIFSHGELKYNFCSITDTKELNDYNSFKLFMEKAVVSPKMFYISESEYFDILLNAPINNAVVYFSKSGCPDCTAIEKNILVPYFEANKNCNKIYVLDCAPYQANLSQEDYLLKKDELCLSSTSDKFGYGSGVFPTLYYINECTIQSGAVAYNDSITKTGNKYTVTDSYYSEERLDDLDYLSDFKGTKVIKGLELQETDVNVIGEYISWDKSSATNYYKPLINAFLDYSLTKVSSDWIKKTSR